MDKYIKGIFRAKPLHLLFPIMVVGVTFFSFFAGDGGKKMGNIGMTPAVFCLPLAAAVIVPIVLFAVYVNKLQKLKNPVSGVSLRDEVNRCREVIGGCQFLFDDYLISFECAERVKFSDIECLNWYTTRVKKSYSLRYYMDLKLRDGRVVPLREFSASFLDFGHGSEKKEFMRLKNILLERAPHIRETQDRPLVTFR